MILDCLDWFLDAGANVASIVTAIVAVVFACRYRNERAEKQSRLENYLSAEKAKGTDQGQRGIPHLVAELGMSESDIFDAAFRSKRVRRVTDKDANGFATKIMLESVLDEHVDSMLEGRE